MLPRYKIKYLIDILWFLQCLHGAVLIKAKNMTLLADCNTD